jgi:hypothetical protein
MIRDTTEYSREQIVGGSVALVFIVSLVVLLAVRARRAMSEARPVFFMFFFWGRAVLDVCVV